MDKPSPIQMQKFLGGIEYPVGRADLVRHASACGADDTLLGRLSALPDRTFDGPDAVSRAYANET
jgi:hypothetical protein